MIPLDAESWTLEVLDEELLHLSQQADELRARRRYLTGIRDARIAEADVQAKIASMTDPEKAALAQIVGVDVATIKGVIVNG